MQKVESPIDAKGDESFLCCNPIKGTIAIMDKKGTSDTGNPINQLLDPKERKYNQHSVIHSRIVMRYILGIWNNSVKNINDEQSKNALIKGLKIKFPTAVIKENGNPHAISIGNDTNDKKH